MDRTGNAWLTAEDGTDFIGQNEVVNFPINSEFQDYTIYLANGVDVDTTEYFEVCLSNPTFGVIDAPYCATIYITDDDCKNTLLVVYRGLV